MPIKQSFPGGRSAEAARISSRWGPGCRKKLGNKKEEGNFKEVI
jgi:hypothetical protein